MKISLPARYLWSIIPYFAVLIGIYLLRNVWVAAIGYHLGAIAVLCCDRSWRQKSQGDVRTSAPLLGLNLLMGLGTGVLLYLLWPLLGVSLDIGERLSQLGLTSWPVFAIYYCAINPLVEELFWRRCLETPSSLPAWNDLVFAGYHMLVLALFLRWEWLPVAFVLLTFASWIWGLTAKMREGLPVITGSHLLADIGIIIVVYLHAIEG